MIASNYLTATETQALLAEGRISTDRIIQEHQARYQERDDQVKAWVRVNHSRAINESIEGELKGVVIGIKDIMNTKDFPTEHGSPFHQGEKPGVDAPLVRILRESGAHIIGKTTVDEFACATLKPLDTYNPFDPAYRVGTSSAGSAAAVCDYQCHVALGTQTSASIARPSSYCGIFGFKPTYGAVSIEGVRPLDPRVDTIGLLARSITDIELVAKVLGVFRCQPTPTLPTDLGKAKFGFFKTDVFDQYASKGLKSVWEKAKRSLVEAGAIVEEIELGEEFNGWEGTGGRYDKIVYTGGGISCNMEYKLGRNQVSDTVIERAEHGIDRQEMVKIWDELAALRPKFDKIARKYDGIITPSSLVEAPRRDEEDVPDFCTLWTGLHAPTINIPGFAGENGLPIGLTMVGARYDDARLLGVAKLVTEVFIRAGVKDMRIVPAPEGVVHLKP